MTRYFDPTNDYAFKRIFSDETRLKDFLNVMLDLPEGYKIVSLTHLNADVVPNLYDGKRSFFDLKVKDQSNNWYIVEMQKRSEKDYIKRVQYYSCHSYVEQLKSGKFHQELLPIVVISLMKGKLFPDDVPCISYHKVLETSTKTQHLFDLSYVFIELGKYKSNSINNDREEWMHLFKCAEKEENPPISIRNSSVISSYDMLESYKWTTEQRDAFVRAKLVEDSYDINMTEEFEKGEAKGKAEGIEQGIEQGIEKRNIEIAKKMLSKNTDIKSISEFTGLTEEQVLELQKTDKG